MFCPKCGKQIADGAKFCPGCGAQLSTSKPAFNTTNTSSNNSLNLSAVDGKEPLIMGGLSLLILILWLAGGVTVETWLGGKQSTSFSGIFEQLYEYREWVDAGLAAYINFFFWILIIASFAACVYGYTKKQKSIACLVPAVTATLIVLLLVCSSSAIEEATYGTSLFSMLNFGGWLLFIVSIGTAVFGFISAFKK